MRSESDGLKSCPEQLRMHPRLRPQGQRASKADCRAFEKSARSSSPRVANPQVKQMIGVFRPIRLAATEVRGTTPPGASRAETVERAVIGTVCSMPYCRRSAGSHGSVDPRLELVRARSRRSRSATSLREGFRCGGHDETCAEIERVDRIRLEGSPPQVQTWPPGKPLDTSSPIDRRPRLAMRGSCHDAAIRDRGGGRCRSRRASRCT